MIVATGYLNTLPTLLLYSCRPTQHCAVTIATLLSSATNAMNLKHTPYSTKFWQGKTWANQLFQSFGKENIGEFTIANISYFSESGICLGKILANDIHLPKNFALYGTR